MSLALMFCLAVRAAPPQDLDALVAEALARDPEGRVLEATRAAALDRARSAGRTMDPQLMLGVDALGAPMDSPDPTMAMIGATQMLRGWGEARAARDRVRLDADRIEVDRGRWAADLRLELWQSAATVRGLTEERAVLDQQITAAEAVRELGRARWGVSAPVSPGMGPMPSGGGMGGMGGGSPSMGPMGTAPPVVTPRAGGGGMGGMGGMGAGGGGGAAAPMTPQAPVPPTSSAPSGPGVAGGGLAAILRLDAEVGLLEAERAGLDAQLRGELAVLAVVVGEEAAEAVAEAPSRYLGEPETQGVAPELDLAAVDVRAAQADVQVARRARRPDLMLSMDQRLMPEGEMVTTMGTDVAVGLELPLWGSRGAWLDAARAESTAAESRRDRVEWDLALAIARALAAVGSAEARLAGLETSALPRARQAWATTRELFGAARATADETVLAWQALVQVEREVVVARRDVELRRAELARLEGR